LRTFSRASRQERRLASKALSKWRHLHLRKGEGSARAGCNEKQGESVHVSERTTGRSVPARGCQRRRRRSARVRVWGTDWLFAGPENSRTLVLGTFADASPCLGGRSRRAPARHRLRAPCPLPGLPPPSFRTSASILPPGTLPSLLPLLRGCRTLRSGSALSAFLM
jgi:hypothetical protein